MTAAVMLFVLTFGVSPIVSSYQGDIFVQFMATDGNWADKSITGHAFVCIQLKTNTGLKEDCYGFYPRTTLGALIGGPGVVDNEFDFVKNPPTRFSNIKISVTKTISIDARVKILKLIHSFDKNFSLTSTNCVNFSNEVAKLAGLKVPTSTDLTTPIAYLQELKKLNPGS